MRRRGAFSLLGFKCVCPVLVPNLIDFFIHVCVFHLPICGRSANPGSEAGSFSILQSDVNEMRSWSRFILILNRSKENRSIWVHRMFADPVEFPCPQIEVLK